MRTRLCALFCSVSVGALLAATPVRAAVTMEILPLLPGDTRAEVRAINDSGTLAGWSYTGDGTVTRHAFSWDRSEGLRELLPLGGTFAEAAAINAAGQIAGRSSNAQGTLRAVVWQPDRSATDLGGGEAYGINAAGEVVGTTVANGVQVAFFWSPAAGMQLITSSAPSYPLDINADGVVVGFFNSAGGQRAFSWSLSGGFVDLTPLVGEPATAWGINDLGQIVGGAAGNAFLLRGGTVEWISAGQATQTFAIDINDQSQVYGACDADPENQRSFFWSDATGYRDLGTLGGKYTSPSGIDGEGRIAGWSQNSRKKYHAVLWDPAAGMTDLTAGSSVYSAATALNDVGLVAGWTVQQVKKVTKYPPVLWTVTP